MIIAVLLIFIFIVFTIISNSNSKTTAKETEQRQVQLRNEQAERERQASLLQQRQAEQQKQAEKERLKQQEEQKKQEEIAEQEEQRKSQERKEQQYEEQIRQQEVVLFLEQQKSREQAKKDEKIASYKTNWNLFQTVLRQHDIIQFYHFTDRENITSIQQQGGLYSWLTAERKGIHIPKPGGVGFGRDLDRRYKLENYVRLCFTKNHPMLFIAKGDGRIQNPVILEISVEVALLKDTRFSNMNATKNGHQQGSEIEDLNRIRFDLVRLRNHFDIPQDEKHFYQAEVLVLERIPLEYITNINKF
ncbi:DUF4433 domain-containing protein [Hymenobacter psoromatis]|uniref:DUF4433 domain-containing protein n=1 Tax=Hymenobacter psoromatis TaxID=1484116 RepID=UPI001CBC6F58|nr:DUF4433 domain-containing protein [Hymenobacter psoromatis]